MVLQNSLFLFVLIGAALAQYEMESIFLPYADVPEPAKCTKPGKMCSTCTSVSYCIEMPGGDMIKEDLYDCPAGQTCIDSLNDCTNQTNPKCDSNIIDFAFVCHQLGMFPDPFDCTKYHMCVQGSDSNKAITVNPKPNSYKCGGNFSYDPLSTQCRNKLVNGTCKSFAPPCTTVGQTGMIGANPSMYYICLRAAGTTTAFPNVFLCPFGQVFNGQRCEDQSSPPATNDDGKCVVKGLFADPLNCKAYVECPDKNANPNKRTCSTGLKFNYKQQKCIEFQCNTSI